MIAAGLALVALAALLWLANGIRRIGAVSQGRPIGPRQNTALVLVDPPRAGLDTRTRNGIIEAGIPNISYVSCDPATMARDIKEFVAAGYVVQRVRGIDMFPQSHHIEVIAHLRKP